ncbi:hypothetical protein [Vibrio natriegens]|uniref:hypothetical protein n=1 Tax=Vibrio natriegens TaxID=691 RepID=UPI001FB87796|nr:hypothetical protein [Vibrio natriegens]
MDKKDLNNFQKEVISCDPRSPWSPTLKIFSDSKVSVYYAPFEYINPKAKVAICGITPGKTQASEALATAKAGLTSGLELSSIQREAKCAASFKGFRKPMSRMLDLIGLNKTLDLKSCAELFGSQEDLVHSTSAIRYPTVLARGSDYNGSPKAANHPYLKNMLDTYLCEEVDTLGENCIWIPLGKGANEALNYLVKKKALKDEQLISGLPHPSGANAESIALLLENEYPCLDDYQNRMYQEYLKKQSWERRKNGKPQSEDKYKEIRKSRWEAMLAVRKKYGITS